MCDILKTAGRRAKLTNICALGQGVSVYRVLCTVSQSEIMRYISKCYDFSNLVSRKRLAIERSGREFGSVECVLCAHGVF